MRLALVIVFLSITSLHGGEPPPVRLRLVLTIETKAGKQYQEFDEKLVKDVHQDWVWNYNKDRMMGRGPTKPAKIVIVCRMHEDGRLGELNVGGDKLGFEETYACRDAVRKQSYSARWPSGMKKAIGAKYRDTRFVFSYVQISEEEYQADVAEIERKNPVRIRRQTFVDANPDLDPKVKAMILEGSFRVGFTADQLEASRGKPQTINRSAGVFGLREQWVYGGGSYVYLDDGKVTSWQETERIR